MLTTLLVEKNLGMILSVLACTLLLRATAWGQTPIFEENWPSGTYSIGDTINGKGGWVAHSGGGNLPEKVVAGSLSYPGYPASGIDNSVKFDTTGEDVNHTALSRASGVLYAAFLVNFDTAKSTNSGDYFFHFYKNSSTFKGKTAVKLAANGKLAFGFSKQNNPPTQVLTDSIYDLHTTYLVVIKYKFVQGTTNDSAFLWINPTLGTPEPAPTLTAADVGSADADTLYGVAIRQGSSAQAPRGTIDGIRVDTLWGVVALPIQLASFSASVVRNNDVEVSWHTVSETNNYGFEVERRRGQRSEVGGQRSEVSNQVSGWVKVGFVEGHRTTLEPQSYSYVDRAVPFGKYFYRIKQIDLDGKSETFREMEVNVGVSPDKVVLAQNYPNPFNPTTQIAFSVPSKGRAVLRLYNVLGQEVGVLFDQEVEAGKVYEARYDASRTSSGIYFYTLDAGGQRLVRKMVLLK
jgi:hypothetical protein